MDNRLFCFLCNRKLQKRQREEILQGKKKEFLGLQGRVTAAIVEESRMREDAETRLRKQI